MLGSLAQVLALATLVGLVAAVTRDDLRSKTIPDRLNAALLATGLGFSLVTPAPGLVAALIGAIAGASVLAAVAVVFRRTRGKDGLGFGDVKFLAGAGAWVGWQGLPPLVFVASISALLLVAAQRLARGRFDRDTQIPFGPHLGLATLVVWVAQAWQAAPWS